MESDENKRQGRGLKGIQRRCLRITVGFYCRQASRSIQCTETFENRHVPALGARTLRGTWLANSSLSNRILYQEEQSLTKQKRLLLGKVI